MATAIIASYHSGESVTLGAAPVLTYSSGESVTTGSAPVLSYSSGEANPASANPAFFYAFGESVPTTYTIPQATSGLGIFLNTIQWSYIQVTIYIHPTPTTTTLGITANSDVVVQASSIYVIPFAQTGLVIKERDFGAYGAAIPMLSVTANLTNRSPEGIWFPVPQIQGFIGSSITGILTYTVPTIVLAAADQSTLTQITGKITPIGSAGLTLTAFPPSGQVGTQQLTTVPLITVTGVDPVQQVKGKIQLISYTIPAITIVGVPILRQIARLRTYIDSLFSIRGRVTQFCVGNYGVKPQAYFDYYYNYNQRISAYHDVVYVLATHDKAKAFVDAPYNLKLAGYTDSPYNLVANVRVSDTVDGIYSLVQQYRITSSVDATYGILKSISLIGFTDAPYDIQTNTRVSAYSDIQYGLLTTYRIEGYAVCPYDLIVQTRVTGYRDIAYSVIGNIRVLASTDAVYSLRQTYRILAFIDTGYDLSTNTQVTSWIDGAYALRSRVYSYVDALYIFANPVNAYVDASYSIKTTEDVRGFIASLYSLKGPNSYFIVDRPYLSHKGVQIDLVDAEMSASEGNALWTGTFSIKSVADYSRIRQGDAVTFHFYSDTFDLIVNAKTVNRASSVSYDGKITAVSPSAVLANPIATQISYTNTTATRISSIVSTLSNGTVEWNAIDWLLPAYRFSVTLTDPMSAIDQLAKACGAIVVSNKDGTAQVRPLFPTSPKNNFGGVYDHTLEEFDDILSVDETYGAGVVYNAFKIYDQQATIADTLAWEPDTPASSSGYIVATLSPWRTNVTLLNDMVIAPNVGRPEVVIRTNEQEQITFFNGVGSTSQPVYDILNVEWITVAQSAITFDDNATNLTIDSNGNGIANITYRSRVIRWRVVLANRLPSQFMLSSPQL